MSSHIVLVISDCLMTHLYHQHTYMHKPEMLIRSQYAGKRKKSPQTKEVNPNNVQ